MSSRRTTSRRRICRSCWPRRTNGSRVSSSLLVFVYLVEYHGNNMFTRTQFNAQHIRMSNYANKMGPTLVKNAANDIDTKVGK